MERMIVFVFTQEEVWLLFELKIELGNWLKHLLELGVESEGQRCEGDASIEEYGEGGGGYAKHEGEDEYANEHVNEHAHGDELNDHDDA